MPNNTTGIPWNPQWGPTPFGWTGGVGAAPVAPPASSSGNIFAPQASIDAAVSEGLRLRDIEDYRQQGALDFAEGEFNRWAATPGVTDDEILTRYGEAGEKAGADANTAYGNLRQQLGDNNLFAGSGAGLAAQIETARMGQLTGAARDLRLYKAQADAGKAMQRLQAANELATRKAQGASQLGLDTLGQKAGLDVTLEGIWSGERSANATAKASKKAGKASGAAGVIGGLASKV